MCCLVFFFFGRGFGFLRHQKTQNVVEIILPGFATPVATVAPRGTRTTKPFSTREVKVVRFPLPVDFECSKVGRRFRDHGLDLGASGPRVPGPPGFGPAGPRVFGTSSLRDHKHSQSWRSISRCNHRSSWTVHTLRLSQHLHARGCSMFCQSR